MNGKIIVVGSLNMDLVVSTPHLPQRGETILGGKFNTFPGGKGANQAVAAARMGGDVCMLGRVGADGFGTELLSVAGKDGIDTSKIIIDPNEASGVALITVDSNGQNTIVVASGANMSLTPQDIAQHEGVFQAPGVLVTVLESPLETVRAALTLAKSRGLTTILNPAPARALENDLLSQVDYLIPNEIEALQLSGASNLDSAIEALKGAGVKNLVITLGDKGVLLISGSVRQQIPAYSVRAIDTVAAGDAFVGAFAAGLSQGLDEESAVRLGNAAAAISVTRQGAQPSLPTRAEVDGFLVSH